MPRFMLDTNCMISVVSRVHPHHAAAVDEYNRRLDRGESLVIAAHALAECYSVLTRSPAPLRVPAGQAMAMLDQSFVQNGAVVALDGSDYVALLGSLPARAVTG